MRNLNPLPISKYDNFFYNRPETVNRSIFYGFLIGTRSSSFRLRSGHRWHPPPWFRIATERNIDLDVPPKKDIPFILFTNGGGDTEARQAASLSRSLGVPLSPKQLVQGHTPFAALVDGPERLRHKSVLVIGGGPNGEAPRTIAESYGFENVFTPADIIAAFPTIWPFPHAYSTTDARQFNKDRKIEAIFVYNNPLDWGPVLQIIVDLLLSSNGQLGTRSTKNGNTLLPNQGYLQDGQPKLYFSNSDLIWNAGYELPRFGTGSFRAALEGVWRAHTGEVVKLDIVEFGKPTQLSFAFAERALESWRRDLLKLGEDEDLPPLEKAFMVGDSPATDIRGANEHVSEQGTVWSSVLVKTGLWDGNADVAYMPSAKVEGIKEAMDFGLATSGL